MKKLTVLFISVLILLTAAGCKAKDGNTNAAKPLSEDVKLLCEQLDVFNDFEASYNSETFRCDFSQDVVNECAADPQYAHTIQKLTDIANNELKNLTLKREYDSATAVNAFLAYDYAFRPAFHADESGFKESLPLLLTEDYIYIHMLSSEDYENHSERRTDLLAQTRAYFSNIDFDIVDSTAVSCATAVFNEIGPKIPEAKKENLEEYQMWIDYICLADKFFDCFPENEKAKEQIAQHNEMLEKWLQELKENESNNKN